MRTKKNILYPVIFVLVLIIACTSFANEIIYVDDDATGGNDGSSWENAYVYLQDALADANSTEKHTLSLSNGPVEIRVAQGTYKPNQGANQIPGDNGASFRLINDVTIRGGYAGFVEPDPNARNCDLYKSIFSGDLNGDDIVADDPCDMLLIQFNRWDNARVVVRARDTVETAVLDGFIVTGGCFRDSTTGSSVGGAGMLIDQAEPTIVNCTFTGNAASKIGGGLLNRGGSRPTLTNCTFTGNYAKSGGGIYNTPSMNKYGFTSEGSHPILLNCTFENNCATLLGGGIYNVRGNPTLTNCTFRCNRVVGPYSMSTRPPPTGAGWGKNTKTRRLVLTDCASREPAAGGGGGICNGNDNSIALKNCTFIGNSASQAGAGLLNSEDSTLTLTNCRFINNTVTGIGGGVWNGSTNAMLVDCVFSGNSAHDGQIPYVSEIIPGSGGGMSTSGNPTLINCMFLDNWASQGGGISNGGDPILIRCTFSGNLAQNGGGMSNLGSGPELSIAHCTFSGNSAELGGGIFYSFNARMKMSNCIFADNVALDGNAIAGEPMEPSLPGYIELTNCILWDGENAIFDPRPDSLTTVISYSNVQGGWDGQGNIDIDPLFADPGYWADANDPNIVAEPDDPNAVWIEGDYHLKSQAGRYDPASGSWPCTILGTGWVIDDVTSPCIDAGDPNSPVGDEPFPNGGIINMGAYGGTSEASLSTRQPLTLPGKASNPYPPDGVSIASRNITLSWTPGYNAVLHDVYFGTDFNDISDATIENPLGVLASQGQDSNLYDPGFLQDDKAYYWRIDELDEQGNKATSDIWMFNIYNLPPKGCACFAGNTCVWGDRISIAISKVVAGQNIKQLDNTFKVEEVQEHEGVFTLYDIVLESGNCITVAENHYFMIESGRWISLHDLKEGQRLRTSKGSVGIKSIMKRPLPYVGKVYNLKIQCSDKYMVGEDAVVVRDY